MTGSPAGHRIRLRGPWTFVWLDEAGLQVGTPARKQHPVDWPEFTRGQSGTVRLTRTFHAPSNLDPDESVSVIVTGVRGHGEVRLNGELLGTFTADQSDCDFPLPLPLPFGRGAIFVTPAVAAFAALRWRRVAIVALRLVHALEGLVAQLLFFAR